MLGSKTRRITPIAALTLEDLVPADHFYRHLDRTFDLTFVRDLVAGYYSPAGRPRGRMARGRFRLSVSGF